MPVIYVKQMELQDDRIIVLPANEQMSAGGIIIPDTKEDKPHYGTIVAVGTSTTPEKRLPFTKGMEVLYGKYAGTEMDFLDDKGVSKTFIIMRAVDIISIIHPLPETKK